MGFDITFHATSREEINNLLINTINNPEIIDKEIKKITSNVDKQEELKNLYNQLLAFITDRNKDEELNISNTIGFAFSAINGYIHPYFYSRGESLTLNGNFDKVKNILSDFIIDKKFMQDYNLTYNQEIQNYSIGGYIENKNLDRLKDIIKNKKLFEDKDNKKALLNLIEYAQKNNLDIFEVSDVVIPINGQCYSDFSNFKAYFLKNKQKKSDNENITNNISKSHTYIREPLGKIKSFKDLFNFKKGLSFKNYISLYIISVILIFSILYFLSYKFLLIIPILLIIIINKKRYYFKEYTYYILKFFIDLFIIGFIISIIGEILGL